MAILHRLLRCLELLEQAAEFADFLFTPAGLTIGTCLLSYQALRLAGCDGLSASILASTVALTLHCGLNRPRY